MMANKTSWRPPSTPPAWPPGAIDWEEIMGEQDHEAPQTWSEMDWDEEPERFKFTPPPRDGIHRWLMTAAWERKRAGLTAEDAVKGLLKLEGELRRPYGWREVENAVEKVYATKVDKKSHRQTTQLPDWNELEVKRIAQEHPVQISDLEAKSKSIPDQRGLLQFLFPDSDRLLCLGADPYSFTTRLLVEFIDLHAGQFIVPAYMTAPEGKTLAGKLSAHSLENTGPLCYIVFDFDKPSSQEQLAVIVHLFRFRAPVLVLHSGGKSFHAWFRASENPSDDVDFWKLGIALGADAAIFRNRSSFVRLPMGRRDNGKVQQVHYFDPDATAENIGDVVGYLASILPEKVAETDFKFFTVDDFDEPDEEEHLVEGLLGIGSSSVVYGPSGCRKTFWVLDVAAHIASGNPWNGRSVTKGAVIYLALEGKSGFKRRMKALKIRGILPLGAELHVTFDPVTLPRDSDRLVSAVNAVCERCGIVPVLVVIDTLARSMSGGDENSGKDMAEVISAVDQIRAATGAHVLVVHHAGKDEGRGARGHSSLRAAVDTEIKVGRQGEVSIAEVRKQRDLEEGESMPFTLDPVEIGVDRKGRVVTSAVVVQKEASEFPPSEGRAAISPESLLELLPVSSTADWVTKAKGVLGLSRTKFYELKKLLSPSSYGEVEGQIRKGGKSS